MINENSFVGYNTNFNSNAYNSGNNGLLTTASLNDFGSAQQSRSFTYSNGTNNQQSLQSLLNIVAGLIAKLTADAQAVDTVHSHEHDHTEDHDHGGSTEGHWEFDIAKTQQLAEINVQRGQWEANTPYAYSVVIDRNDNWGQSNPIQYTIKNAVVVDARYNNGVTAHQYIGSEAPVASLFNEVQSKISRDHSAVDGGIADFDANAVDVTYDAYSGFPSHVAYNDSDNANAHVDVYGFQTLATLPNYGYHDGW